MDEVAKYMLLGLLQGATEFLPVSSSGHLVAAQALLGLDAPGLLVEVSLHFGTLLAILVVFRRDLLRLASDAVKGVVLLARGRAGEVAEQAPRFPVAVAIAIGSVPAAVVVLCLHDSLTDVFQNVQASSALLVLTGLLLIASGYAPQGTKTTPGPREGFAVGVAQAAALLPGISRSGATIVAGYFLGIQREEAARFSFLLAVPALAAAMALEVFKLLRADAPQSVLAQGGAIALACGTATAALVGWLALVLLFKVVRKGKLHWFGAYCVPAGILFFVLSLLS